MTGVVQCACMPFKFKTLHREIGIVPQKSGREREMEHGKIEEKDKQMTKNKHLSAIVGLLQIWPKFRQIKEIRPMSLRVLYQVGL